jgi:hypothetical protein
LNGNIVITNDGEDPNNNRVCVRFCQPTTTNCSSIDVTSPFSLEYLENDLDAELVLEWGDEAKTAFTVVGAEFLVATP